MVILDHSVLAYFSFAYNAPAIEVKELFLAIKMISDDGLKKRRITVFDPWHDEFQVIRNRWFENKQMPFVVHTFIYKKPDF